MLRRSSRINNRKILKTVGSDGVAPTSSCDSSEARVVVPDYGGESSSGAASAGLGPLQNVVVLGHLFELCPADVLATCRLVCKQWYEESLRTWRNSIPLTFTLKNGCLGMKYVGDDGEGHSILLQDFLEYANDPTHQCQKKPHRYIRIKNSLVDSNMENKKQFDVFWNAVGSNLTTLELKRCTFTDDEEFRRIIFTHCPKLERLIIDECRFPTSWMGSFAAQDPLDYKVQPLEQNKNLKVLNIGYNQGEINLPVPCLELLSHFPLISSLTYDNGSTMDAEDFDILTKAIRIIRNRDEKLLPIKVFDMGHIRIPTESSYLTLDETLAIFLELRLPLQGLWVTLESDDDYNSFEYDFADSWHLLNDVLSLYIDTNTNEDNFLLFCKLLAFLNHMPNVEFLRITNDQIVMEDLGKMAVSNVDTGEPVQMMLKLTQLMLDCKIKDGDIAKFHNWMPNVTSLTIFLNDKQFGIVCKTWRNLKDFVVWGDELTDDGVIGNKYGYRASIQNLKKLEKFGFESNKLTDKSVFHGFLKLPNLRVIEDHGWRGPRIKWGERARRAMLDRNIQIEQA